MFHLAIYYEFIENYSQMKKYYKKAINKKHFASIYYFGSYYRRICKNEKMKLYFMYAIENIKNTDFTDTEIPFLEDIYFSLGSYFELIEQSVDKMEYYYLKAIEIGKEAILDKLILNNNIDMLNILYKGAEMQNKKCIDAINGLLKRSFSFKHALKSVNFLDENNYKKLMKYLRIHNTMKEFIVDDPDDFCLICCEMKKIYVLNCDHKICCFCYEEMKFRNTISCPFCRKEI